jgi:hypothetical protein
LKTKNNSRLADAGIVVAGELLSEIFGVGVGQ